MAASAESSTTGVSHESGSSSGASGPPPRFWEERYGSAEFAYGTEPNAWIQENADLVRGNVIDLGSGEGRCSVWAAGRPEVDSVSAVDASAAGAEKCKALAAKAGTDKITAIVGDATKWRLSEEAPLADALLCVFLHLPPSSRPMLWATIRDSIKPGGILVAEWYHPEHVKKAYGTGGPKSDSMCIAPQEIAQALGGKSAGEASDAGTEEGKAILREAGFEYLAGPIEYDVKEGLYHTGKGAVTRVRWRKPEDSE